MAKQERDIFNNKWIVKNAIEVLERYEPGILSVRALFYQLVSIGMTNSQRHYKRVVAATGEARREGLIAWNAFSDRDREMKGVTRFEDTNVEDKADEAKEQIRLWMHSYSKNRWEGQKYYPEVWIEKKALEGVFERPCKENQVTLGACKGYPSLTFLYEASLRFKYAERRGKEPIILYFGDYDPSGEDIPRKIQESLKEDFGIDVELQRKALTYEQVISWKLPPAPVKETDSRTANWGGIGQVELDAVKPEKLKNLLNDALAEIFDYEVFEEIEELEESETEEFRGILKEYVKSL